jgi:hypothetical protein
MFVLVPQALEIPLPFFAARSDKATRANARRHAHQPSQRHAVPQS